MAGPWKTTAWTFLSHQPICICISSHWSLQKKLSKARIKLEFPEMQCPLPHCIVHLSQWSATQTFQCSMQPCTWYSCPDCRSMYRMWNITSYYIADMGDFSTRPIYKACTCCELFAMTLHEWPSNQHGLQTCLANRDVKMFCLWNTSMVNVHETHQSYSV